MIKLYVDAAANRIEKVVNSYGKKLKWNDGYKIAVVSDDGSIKKTFVNRKASHSLMAEAYALLKAVEVAIEADLREVELVSDAVGSLNAPTGDGDMYLAVARRLINENGLQVVVSMIPSAQNPADALSREASLISPRGPATGSLDDLIAKCGAYGPAKIRLRSLVKKKGINLAWQLWNEIEPDSFRIDGKTVGRSAKPSLFLERLAA